MRFLPILTGGKRILITGEEHSYNSSEFWPAISRREYKYLNPHCGTKAIVFSFVPGAVSEGHKSGCKATDFSGAGDRCYPRSGESPVSQTGLYFNRPWM